MTGRTVRIGCASGFWGDTPEAVGQLVTRGEIDYLVFDYLAEITMSLLARARTKSPEAGYDPDFLQAVAPFLRELKRKGIKVVANAGGVNPRGCREALAKAAEAAGIDISIGAITTLTLAAIDAPAKAEHVAEAILTRCRRIFRGRNLGDFRQVGVEVLGAEAAYGANARARTREVVLKIGAVHDDRDALNIFAGEIAPMAVSSAQGLTGFFAGRPKVQPVVRLFSFLQRKADTPVTVEVDGEAVPVQVATEAVTLPAPKPHRGEAGDPAADAVTVPLAALAWARSGDKGNIANIGGAALTEERVKAYFAHVCEGPVERFELPGIRALNFLLHDSLGGGIASVRIDPQGKGYGQILLDIGVSVPAELALRDGLSAQQAA